MMTLALKVLLILFCLQGLFKFSVGFLVPYRIRIKQIASYYEHEERVIKIYDDVMLGVLTALVALLLLTEMQYLSFITGFVVGAIIIQIFFHRFNRVLPAEKAPDAPPAPNKLISYAIQEAPGRGWKEVVFMTAVFVWALYMLVIQGLLG